MNNTKNYFARGRYELEIDRKLSLLSSMTEEGGEGLFDLATALRHCRPNGTGVR